MATAAGLHSSAGPRTGVRGGLTLLLALGLLGPWSLPPRPAAAQYSPLCERNGRRDYCAFTFDQGRSNAREEVGTLLFADHTRVDVIRELGSCRSAGAVTTCRARLRVSPGSGQELQGTYKGTAYEGGYSHAYSARGIRVKYVFVD